MPVGFWDTFFDSDYRQRSDLNAVRDDAVATANEIDVVRGQVMRLQRQVSDLSILVNVLVRILEEGGNMDAKVLRYRVEAELEQLTAARMPPPQPVAAKPPEPQAPTTPTLCRKCGQTVPANRTTFTETGVVCDGCLSK